MCVPNLKRNTRAQLCVLLTTTKTFVVRFYRRGGVFISEVPSEQLSVRGFEEKASYLTGTTWLLSTTSLIFVSGHSEMMTLSPSTLSPKTCRLARLLENCSGDNSGGDDASDGTSVIESTRSSDVFGAKRIAPMWYCKENWRNKSESLELGLIAFRRVRLRDDSKSVDRGSILCTSISGHEKCEAQKSSYFRDVGWTQSQIQENLGVGKVDSKNLETVVGPLTYSKHPAREVKIRVRLHGETHFRCWRTK